MNDIEQEVVIKITDEKDLYNSFSPEKEFSEDVVSYIGKRIDRQRNNRGLLVKVLSEKPINEKDFETALQNLIINEKERVARLKQIMFYKQLWMFSVGTFFIAISLFLQSHISVLPYTILSTIGAFAMWEAAAIWIIEKPKLKIRKKLIDKYTLGYKIEFELSE